MSGDRQPGRLDEAIHVDEAGLAFGIYGDMRLHAMAALVFARGVGGLVPVAAEGFVEPRRAGRPMPPRDALEQVPEMDRPFVERLGRALILANHRNIAIDGLDLLFGYGPAPGEDAGAALGEIRLAAGRLDELGLDPARLVCVVSGSDPAGPALLGPLAGELRALGIRLAVDGVGAGHAGLDHIRLLRPEMVAVDAGWFGRLAGRDAALGLFAALVRMLHGQGAAVLVRGLDDPMRLRIALDCGADLFQGTALARPAAIGSVLDETPVPLPAPGLHRRNVVPLAVPPAIHQLR